MHICTFGIFLYVCVSDSEGITSVADWIENLGFSGVGLRAMLCQWDLYAARLVKGVGW